MIGETEFNNQKCPMKYDSSNNEIHSGYFKFKLAYEVYEKKS